MKDFIDNIKELVLLHEEGVILDGLFFELVEKEVQFMRENIMKVADITALRQQVETLTKERGHPRWRERWQSVTTICWR